MQPRFGRIYIPDERDKAYPMRLRLDPLRAHHFPRGLPEGSRHYNPGPVLNQGQTGTCVAHGWQAKMEAAPVMQKLPMTVFDFYRRVVARDEWTQNDFEATAPDTQLQFGTSVRAGGLLLREMGFLANILWAESVEDVRAWHLAGFGGCVIGVNWTDSMMTVDRDGFISYHGTVEGGHCVVTTGWNDKVKRGTRLVRAVRIQNSWDTSWGQGGRAWIEETDLAKLMADQGEICAPTEVRVKR